MTVQGEVAFPLDIRLTSAHMLLRQRTVLLSMPGLGSSHALVGTCSVPIGNRLPEPRVMAVF